MEIIYKVLTSPEWEDVKNMGIFTGSTVDVRDGYMHFSTAEQVEETIARHYSGAIELVLAAVTIKTLGAALRWEPSRGGALFPHLYGPLRIKDILWGKMFDARFPTELQRLLAE